jgi:hypothetical protein
MKPYLHLTEKEFCLAQYLLELSLTEFSLNVFRPSIVCAAVIHLTFQVSLKSECV